MQQTETYQLNLIESKDTFSPAPLNENAQKLEGALSAETAARTALENRVAALEVQHIFYGTFSNDLAEQTIDLGVTPLAVYVHTIFINGHDYLVLSTACGGSGANQGNTLQIVPNGFVVKSGIVSNDNTQHFNFIAFA